MTPLFRIGDQAWVATTQREELRLVCEDCAGERFLTVVPANGKPVTIDCTGCSVGYEGPRGYVITHTFQASVREVTITKVAEQVDHVGPTVEYGSVGGYVHRSEDVFKTKDAALARAAFLADQHTRETRKQLRAKEKPTHSWAWNATYHRQQIRDAEKSLAYHRGKLDVARVHAKETEVGS